MSNTHKKEGKPEETPDLIVLGRDRSVRTDSSLRAQTQCDSPDWVNSIERGETTDLWFLVENQPMEI
jgi:hypothetical protein